MRSPPPRQSLEKDFTGDDPFNQNMRRNLDLFRRHVDLTRRNKPLSREAHAKRTVGTAFSVKQIAFENMYSQGLQHARSGAYPRKRITLLSWPAASFAITGQAPASQQLMLALRLHGGRLLTQPPGGIRALQCRSERP